MVSNYISQLRQILETGGFSQRQLAERLGVTFAALNRWLNGHAVPRPQKLSKIEALFREEVGYAAITEQEVRQLVREAAAFKRPRLWGVIAKQSALQDDLLLEHTYNSTSIEGTTFTKHQTEAVLFDHAMIPDKSLIEHLEVTNHAAALRRLFQQQYGASIDEGLVKALHRDLMQGIRQDAGEYSTHYRAIRGVDMMLTHPKDIPEEMGNLLTDWNRLTRRTIRDIGVFHARFELIHPFGDGNGRVGRLLMVMQCLQHDYPPVVIENERKAECYDALAYAQRKSEGPFIKFLVDEMRRTRRILQKHRVV